MQAGDELVVPVAVGCSAAPGQQRYTVRRGDTLVTVADRFSVSVEQLRRLEQRVRKRLQPGRSHLRG